MESTSKDIWHEVKRAVLVAVVLLSFAGLGRAQYSASAASFNATTASPTVSDINSLQNPFLGSISSGAATPETLRLSLKDAIERGLRYNLGVLLDEQSTRAARGERAEALSHLLPHLMTGTSESREMVNLAAIGLPSTIKVNPISGPFNVFNARMYASSPILDFHALRNAQSASEQVLAAHYTYQDARNLVVFAVGNAYLVTIAARARVRAAQAEVNTAQALYQQAADRYKNGLSPEIDMLRAQVELKSRQETLIAARNDHRTAKLNVARVIGLPDGQKFVLSTEVPFEPFEGITPEKAIAEAYENRPDYKAALAEVRAAQAHRRAVIAERYPSFGVEGNFGDLGLRIPYSHETFLAAATLTIPLFQGGKVRGELVRADAQLKQTEEQLNNLKGQIGYDVRTALMNLETASEQVAVAHSNVSLAHTTLAQAQDRFAAGVTDNIEVVEAQEAVASADEAYIASLYQHNVAKVALARALGIAEQAALNYLGGK
jgi:outer membrane protein TolC